MARQQLGKKKVDKLRSETGLDIVKVLVRGGTDHRRDLCLSGGQIVSLYKDGEMKTSTMKWQERNA